MKCKNCGGIIYNGCCLKCGLMENGNFIQNPKKEPKIEEIEKYNEDYDIMLHNENWYVPFIIGHLYFSYRNYFLLGILFEIIEIFFQIAAFYIQAKTIFQDLLSVLLTFILSFLFVRIIISIIANPIILFFDKKKVKMKYKHKIFKSMIKLIVHILIDINLLQLLRII